MIKVENPPVIPPAPDLSGYWKTDGSSSPSTGAWYLGSTTPSGGILNVDGTGYTYAINATGSSKFTDGTNTTIDLNIISGGGGSLHNAGIFTGSVDGTVGAPPYYQARLGVYANSGSGAAGSFFDSAGNGVDLSNGTYAINATGTINQTGGTVHFDNGPSVANVDLFGVGGVGYFSNPAGSVGILDGTYAINATGNIHAVSSDGFINADLINGGGFGVVGTISGGGTAGGYFDNGAIGSVVQLATSGGYAINATGANLFTSILNSSIYAELGGAVGGYNQAGYFTDGSMVAILIDNSSISAGKFVAPDGGTALLGLYGGGAGGTAGQFANALGGNTVNLSDNTYAINATGNTQFAGGYSSFSNYAYSAYLADPYGYNPTHQESAGVFNNSGSGATVNLVSNSLDTAAQFDSGSLTYAIKATGNSLFTGNVTLSNMTAGSVLFAGTAGVVSQDNANFFWDATNHRLGIGTATPYAFMHASYPTTHLDASLTYNTPAVAIVENWGVQLAMGISNTTSQPFYLQTRQSANVSWPLAINPLGGNVLLGKPGSYVGIGTVTPQMPLQVSDTALNPTYAGYYKASIAQFVGNRNDGNSFGFEVRNTNTSNLAFAAINLSLGTTNEGGGIFASRAATSSYGIANGLNFSPNLNTQDIGFRAGVAALGGTANGPNLIISHSGGVGIAQPTPTALLHIGAGTATAGTAPLKFTSGVSLTTAEAGAVEYDGTHLLASPAGALRERIPTGWNATGTLTAGTTTTVTDARAKTTSTIFLQSTSAAFNPLGAYISTKNNGSFVITTLAAAGSETFDYLVVN